MKIYKIFLFVIFFMISCVNKHNIGKKVVQDPLLHEIDCVKINDSVRQQSSLYNDCIYRCAYNYGIDVFLIKSIIKAESNYDPTVISESNAVGLMQLKPDMAGKDVYRLKGKQGEPSIYELKNAIINIDFGTAYLYILQRQLNGIIDLKTRRYALIVAYVNGLNALLQIFAVDRSCAIKKINTFNAQQFYQYIQCHHPSEQAKRYLSKVNKYYLCLTM